MGEALEAIMAEDALRGCMGTSRATSRNPVMRPAPCTCTLQVALSYDTPLCIVRGVGCYLYDEQGNEYLDSVNNVAHVGHCHPRVTAAVCQQ